MRFSYFEPSYRFYHRQRGQTLCFWAHFSDRTSGYFSIGILGNVEVGLHRGDGIPKDGYPVQSMPERIITLCPEVMTFVTADSRVMVLSVLMTILTYSAVFNSPKMPLMAIHTVAMRI